MMTLQGLKQYVLKPFKYGGAVGTRNEISRQDWIEQTLKKIPAGYSILDAGAGECQFKKFCSHLRYTSQDFAQYDGQGDGKGFQLQTWDNTQLDIVSDITAIPVADKSFEAVMCTEVLEHVPDPVAALRELNRILKPGGYLLLTAPFCSLTHFSPYHFSTGFNRYFYRHHLEGLGYEIIDSRENGNFFEWLAQEIRRIPSVSKEYAGESLSAKEKVAMNVMLQSLDRLSAKGDSSKDLLCFGYHIFAKKRMEV